MERTSCAAIPRDDNGVSTIEEGLLLKIIAVGSLSEMLGGGYFMGDFFKGIFYYYY